MAQVHAYLNFDGNCEEAFLFYEKVFKTKNLGFMRFKDIPADPNMPPMADKDKDKIMHTGIFINANTMLMGSDVIDGFGHKYSNGNNTYVMLTVDSVAEGKELYDALSAGSKNLEMPLGETFFAEQYASFQDKFGIWWMIYFEGNKKMG